MSVAVKVRILSKAKTSTYPFPKLSTPVYFSAASYCRIQASWGEQFGKLPECIAVGTGAVNLKFIKFPNRRSIKLGSSKLSLRPNFSLHALSRNSCVIP